MRKLLVVMMLLWGVGAVVNAAEIAGQPVDVTFDVTYASKYIWRGFNLFGENGAIQPSLDLALENGLSFNVWAAYPAGSGSESATEYDYTVAYSNTAFAECPWKTDYSVGWRYYDYIQEPSKDLDVQEVFAEVSMPELLDNGIVPHAAYYQMWNAQSDAPTLQYNGSIFVVGFGYGFTLDQAPELPMNFTWDIIYNDGVGASTVDHDWSHMLWGLSTEIKCPMTGATITPAIYFQNVFEDSVNSRGDELFGTLSYTLSF